MKWFYSNISYVFIDAVIKEHQNKLKNIINGLTGKGLETIGYLPLNESVILSCDVVFFGMYHEEITVKAGNWIKLLQKGNNHQSNIIAYGEVN